ncbi:MAG: metal ABC transporter ATP-binding protein [Planctomycetia bacterium]|nr:metal ABC transporter ATP-binding protein [Planctomycetia bacterium]
MTASEDVIQVNRLTFSYRAETTLLSNITFSIARGDFVGIIGSNGSGKSTLLKLLLGQLPAPPETVFLYGEDVRTFHRWSKIGYVPQSHHYLGVAFPATVEEMILGNMFSQIGLFRFPHRQHRVQVERALAQVGMEDSLHARIGTLSGGQMQRVLIARVLVNDPEILLLDEPTNGMDAESARSFYGLLQSLHAEQKRTLLMVTHDLQRTAEYFQRIFCLEEGSLVELTPSQLEHELAHRHRHPDGKTLCPCQP